MISGLFIQSRRKRKRSGCCRFTHDTLGEKPFFSPQRLTKNIFKNYSLLLIQRFLFFQCETLLQYVYSIRCTVQYMKVLHSTAQASPLNRVCSQLVTSWLLQDCECTTRNHTQFSSHLFFVLQSFCVFFFYFFFFYH